MFFICYTCCFCLELLALLTYYYATTMYEDIDKEVAEGIKLLGVNGVKPSYETIKDNSWYNSSAPSATPYRITLNRILKRVNGEFRLTRVQAGSYVSKSITFNLTLPPTVTPPMVDAFFESALAAFIVKEYSGITKYGMPEVKKYAFDYLLDVVEQCIRQVYYSSFTPPTWDDKAIFAMFNLTSDECQYIQHRLLC